MTNAVTCCQTWVHKKIKLAMTQWNSLYLILVYDFQTILYFVDCNSVLLRQEVSQLRHLEMQFVHGM
jgi:hypothetical protein